MTAPDQPLTLLGGLTPTEFLRDYWQQRPLLVRGAFPGFISPIAPDELAGLSLEEEVESRLILEKDGPTPWHLEHGPFSEGRFEALPASHWTLLLQEANKHVPELALLQEPFTFIPNWRLDDVMVSYAAPEGTVGPHADNYDVFLIQAHGTRRWQINTTVPTADDLLPGLPLRILRDFRSEHEWVVEPGDLLYLPPGVAHHGVALEECMTISVGFRAPSEQELLAAWAAECVHAHDPEQFYSDPGLAMQAHPGALHPEALAKVRHLIRSLAGDDTAIDHWFARHISDLRPGHWLPEPEAPLDGPGFLAALAQHGEVWRSEYARHAYLDHDERRTLYVAGEAFPLSRELAPLADLYADRRVIDQTRLSPWFSYDGALDLWVALYNLGAVYFPMGDEEE